MRVSYRDRMSPEDLRQFDELRAGIRARDARRRHGGSVPLPRGTGTMVLAVLFIGIPIAAMLWLAVSS